LVGGGSGRILSRGGKFKGEAGGKRDKSPRDEGDIPQQKSHSSQCTPNERENSRKKKRWFWGVIERVYSVK